MKYRREIDGLRAVAVLPVVLFHAGFNNFSGGYVGVDVFFVISGYLITSILIGELEQADFSIARFYERRARRILPALFIVILACLPFAYLWMMPTQLKDFARSLVAVVFFGSNILFTFESGYFGSDAELKPLLHTWSLAVEEQYYLLFPVFLLLAWSFGRNKLFLSVVVVTAFSLLLAEWGWRNNPSANFYLAPTRAWELLAGSICAFLTVGRTPKSKNLLSAVGLTAIVFSIFSFDKNTPFPSVYALVPVVGTALIILFGRQGTWVAKLLSMRAFVGVGLISYSAYLWHQPLFAFARLRSTAEPSHDLMAALVLSTFLLAWATWRWVEQPLRKRTKPILATRRSVFVASGVVGAVIVAIGFAGYLSGGLAFRLPEQVTELEKRTFSFHDIDACRFAGDSIDFDAAKACLKNRTIYLIGDSHAGAISSELRRILSDNGYSLLTFTHHGCLPVIGVTRLPKKSNTNCERFKRSVFEFVDEFPNPIVFSARWRLNLEGDRYDNGEGGIEAGNSGQSYVLGDDGYTRDVAAHITAFFFQLSQAVPVIIINQIPEAGWNVFKVASHSAMFGDLQELNLTTSYDIYKIRNENVQQIFSQLEQQVLVVRSDKLVCSEETGRCLNMLNNFPLYRDGNHPSPMFAEMISQNVLFQLKKYDLSLQ